MPYFVSFTEKEFFILQRLVSEAQKNMSDSRLGTGVGLKLTLSESYEIDSLYKKICFHEPAETEDPHTEGTFA